MGKYAEIIERLEKAEGPDRNLDWLIAEAALGATRRDRMKGFIGEQPIWQYTVGTSSGSESVMIPAYTVSLDAAITLVERMLPGNFREISGPRKYLNIPSPVPARFRAEITTDAWFDSYVGWGQSAPTALLIAMFKALEAREETNA